MNIDQKNNEKAGIENTQSDKLSESLNEINQINKPKNNQKLGIKLAIVAVGFFGFGFALVPLYNTLCKALGIAPSQSVASTKSNIKSENIKPRPVKVSFTHQIMNNADNVEFYPMQDFLEIQTQKKATAKFFIHNKANQQVTFNTIYSLTPTHAGGNLHKIDCFCFTEQTLDAGEKREMPIVFFIDSQLDKYVSSLNMNYALYKVDKNNPQKNSHSMQMKH